MLEVTSLASDLSATYMGPMNRLPRRFRAKHTISERETQPRCSRIGSAHAASMLPPFYNRNVCEKNFRATARPMKNTRSTTEEYPQRNINEDHGWALWEAEPVP